jgi:hypothetical protein
MEFPSISRLIHKILEGFIYCSRYCVRRIFEQIQITYEMADFVIIHQLIEILSAY